MKSFMLSTLVRAPIAFDKVICAVWDSKYALTILNGCIFGALVIAMLITVHWLESDHARKRANVRRMIADNIAAQDAKYSQNTRNTRGWPISEGAAAMPSMRDMICMGVFLEESE